MKKTIPEVERTSREKTETGDMVETLHALSKLMDRETELLRAMRFCDFSALQEKKLALIKSYEEKLSELREQPDFSKNLDPHRREELSRAARNMQKAMGENEQAIRAARELNQRVATAIVDAVQSERPQAGLYAQDGGPQDKGCRPPLSIQIDGRF